MAAHATARADRPLVIGFGEEASRSEEDKAGEDTAPVPVTVLTGFLGSGKTTLLNRILTTNHGKRIAVIQNEFGEDLGLGSALSAEGGGGEVFEESYEMNNGCICCSVRDDLVNTLEAIMRKRHKFDYVVVESTGMANPGPIASIFWLDEELGSNLCLDAIVTLVDAKHILQHLDDTSENGGAKEAAQQIAFADRILLNKIDLVSEEVLARVEQRIRQINALAPIFRTTKSDIDLGNILNVRAFDESRAKEVEQEVNQHGCGECGAKDGDACDHTHSHENASTQHDSGIKTVSVTESRPLDLRQVNLWLGNMLWEEKAGEDIFRLKGILSVAGDDCMTVLQGVHTLFELNPSNKWDPAAERRSKLVFIGRNLDRAALQQGLSSCVADKEPEAGEQK